MSPANVIAPCLLTPCLSVPNFSRTAGQVNFRTIDFLFPMVGKEKDDDHDQSEKENPPNKSTQNKKLIFSEQFRFLPQPPPPPEILCVGPSSCILQGKEAPNIKNLRGQGSLEGGSGRGGGGFTRNSLCLCLSSGPD